MNQDPLALAEAQPEYQSRSKLDPYRAAILALRKKRWPYTRIAEWLCSQGVQITFSSVRRFCKKRPKPITEPAEESLDSSAQRSRYLPNQPLNSIQRNSRINTTPKL